MRTFISFSEAQETILDSARETETEYVSLAGALGRTLSADIVSADNIPPFDNSAMDGYAVHAADCTKVPVRLRVAGEIPAGQPLKGSVPKGSCVRIMTGSPTPESIDTVVPVEVTRADGDHVWIDVSLETGSNIRPLGRDVRSGDSVFARGTHITPPVIGMLATLGVVPVPVSIRPRVAVISTGDEIVPPSETPGPGQIRNSNGPALAAQVVAAGAELIVLEHAPDDRQKLRELVSAITNADLVLFSGGVSMGAYDFVRSELEDMGARWEFWKVKQRPGKPLIFGGMNSMLLLGLPGNPVSSAVCFEIYVRPLLASMMGRTTIRRSLLPARLSRSMKKVKGLHYFARGITEETEHGLRVSDTGPQGSNLYTSMVKANCLIHMPEEMENPAEGAEVFVEQLDW